MRGRREARPAIRGRVGDQRHTGRKVLALFATATALTGLFGVANATPAAADVCGYPGCGGTVVNASSYSVRIANTWCWSAPQIYFGTRLPCVANPDNRYAYQSDTLLRSGEDSSYTTTYYYDTDAFRVPGRCTTTYYWGSAWDYPQYETPSSDMWIRITGRNRVTVTSIRC